MRGKALFVDIDDDKSVIGIAPQRDDGMFYIPDDGTARGPRALIAKDRDFMGVIRQHGVKKQPAEENKPKSSARSKKAAQLWYLRLGYAMILNTVLRNIDFGYLNPP